MFAEETENQDKESSGGKGKLFAFILAAVGALGFFLKKKRERELDEALWEEPRSL
jgi:hypothetical protein